MSTCNNISVGLVALGCAKNNVDLQIMCGVLLTEGIELGSPDHCDILLINTCAFIHDARDEAYAEITRAIELKKQGEIKGIIVSGCLAQRYGADLSTQFPEVDAYLGIDKLEDVAALAKRIINTKTPRIYDCVTKSPKATFEPRIPTFTIADPQTAYIKIAEGCNHACAYCAIPGIRGHLRSRTIDNIVSEASALLEDGKRDLNLIAQDVTAYGYDKRNSPRLPDLLHALDTFKGKYFLRLLYAYPSLVTDELLNCFKTLKHLSPYLDIPIQHSHPDILTSMLRKDTILPLQNLTMRLRSACPNIVLRTTCLVGFPGETDEHFNHLCNYIKSAKFDALGVFTFSPEEGTPAATLPNQVPHELAEMRRKKLMQIQKRIATTQNKNRIGTKTPAIILAPLKPNLYLARTTFQAPDVDGITYLHSSKKLTPGSIHTITLTSTQNYDLLAQL